jgi:hypothetical protein
MMFGSTERWTLRSISPALMACCLLGCGSTGPAGKVEGRVTVGGTPVPAGTLVMFTEGPEPFTATIGTDGTFVTDKAVKVGTYAVAIQEVEKELSYEDSKKAGATGTRPVFQSVVPEKYRFAGTSEVKFEVKAGETNKFELDMVPGATIPGTSSGGSFRKGGKG